MLKKKKKTGGFGRKIGKQTKGTEQDLKTDSHMTKASLQYNGKMIVFNQWCQINQLSYVKKEL